MGGYEKNSGLSVEGFLSNSISDVIIDDVDDMNVDRLFYNVHIIIIIIIQMGWSEAFFFFFYILNIKIHHLINNNHFLHLNICRVNNNN
jgi:hypothetical protein